MYTIYDCHAHIYPQKIAIKAATAIGDFYHTPMYGDGTPDMLVEQGKAAGISRFLVHSVATVPHQVASINRFILGEVEKHPEFIPFMTLHQDLTADEIEQEVEWAIQNGFKGIKLHPDFQKFAINSPEAQKMYQVVGGRLPFLLHTGDKRYNYSHPQYLAEMAKKYPDTRFVGAHFGAWSCWDWGYDCYRGLDNVWFDTSSSLFWFAAEDAAKRILDLGVDRYFFGTDYPMWSAAEEVERFLKLPLTEDAREKIFAKNLHDFLALD